MWSGVVAGKYKPFSSEDDHTETIKRQTSDNHLYANFMQNEKIVRSKTSLNISNKDLLSNNNLNSVTLKPNLPSPENTQDQNRKVVNHLHEKPKNEQLEVKYIDL